ncbi:MAG TPA: cysteine synthase family protein [Bacteroidota bacterium]|nr:cysteine synthase family protein [Bacteroidota bacterium]
MMIASNILEAIGNTPIVQLRKVVPPHSARVLVKLEWANPTGSMKDRMAKGMIERAEANGRLLPGGTVVEYTGGTTGVSLAFVCAAKGYHFHAVFSDAFSDDKRVMMQAFGAKVTDVISENKMITEKLIRGMIEKSRSLAQQPGHWWSNQLSNDDGIPGYHALGEEIWNATDGKIDAFIQSVGTAHSIHGVTTSLWKHNPKIHITAVEPAESPVLSGGEAGAHQIEGIGIGFTPPLWDRKLVNEVTIVSTEEARMMARRLASEEGLFAGTSSGGNVAAALRLARRLGPNATVVTLLIDSGLRYVSTDLYPKL